PSRRGAAGPGQDLGAALARIERVQDHEARVLDPAVRVREADAKVLLERRARRIAPQIDAPGARQLAATAEMVVQEQAEADQPDRTLLGAVRQNEAQRPRDVRRDAQQNLALDQRLAHQSEFAVFEIAQPAVDQLARRRGGVVGEIVLFAQHDLEAAAGGVAGDAGAVDAAADDQEIDRFALAQADPFPTATARRRSTG